MVIKKYIDVLISEIFYQEDVLIVLAEKATEPTLDPNFRLEQGKLKAMVSILIDLCEITGYGLPSNYYPDSIGLLESPSRADEVQRAKNADVYAHDACVFHYCPSPELCRVNEKGCVHRPIPDMVIRIDDKLHRCDCGASVFKRLSEGKYQCNGCRTVYEAE